VDLIHYYYDYTWYTGLIDDIRIYNRALSDCDVLALFNENLDHKIKICHKGHEIFVDEHSSQAHLSHGDYIGSCSSKKAFHDENIEDGGVTVSQNNPNPFNQHTTIAYSIQDDGIVQLQVFDIYGKMVAELENGMKHAGNYNVIFDGQNQMSGTYFYQIKVNNRILTGFFNLVK